MNILNKKSDKGYLLIKKYHLYIEAFYNCSLKYCLLSKCFFALLEMRELYVVVIGNFLLPIGYGKLYV